MSRFKLRPIRAAAILMFSGSSLAQQQPTMLPAVTVTAPPERGYKTESTSTALGVETPLRDIPQFINTVPEPVIRQQAITSLQEALRNVPGITFTAAEGGVAVFAGLLAAGFSGRRRPLPRRVRDIGEYNRDLFNIDRIEVLKGPSALAFGRGSTGGVINQVTKSPTSCRAAKPR